MTTIGLLPAQMAEPDAKMMITPGLADGGFIGIGR